MPFTIKRGFFRNFVTKKIKISLREEIINKHMMRMTTNEIFIFSNHIIAIEYLLHFYAFT